MLLIIHVRMLVFEACDSCCHKNISIRRLVADAREFLSRGQVSIPAISALAIGWHLVRKGVLLHDGATTTTDVGSRLYIVKTSSPIIVV